MNETQLKNAQKLDFFPFVSGELLLEHRKQLNDQIRAEIKYQIDLKNRKKHGSGDYDRYHDSASALSHGHTSTRNSWKHNEADKDPMSLS